MPDRTDNRSPVWGGATLGLIIGLVVGIIRGSLGLSILYGIVIGASGGDLRRVLELCCPGTLVESDDYARQAP